MAPPIEFAERTHPGRDPGKQINEDACGHRETALGHLAVVCDGMGGHEGGREASHLAVETIFSVFEQYVAAKDADPHEPARVLREAIEEANRRVYAMPSSDPTNPARAGATVVAVLHHRDGTEVAHAGDSRCYLIHGGDIVQLTKDHSMVQQMVDAQLLTPEQAAVHPDANRISRALGMKPEVEVEVRPQPVAHVAGDVFLLCSDGMSDLVGPADVLRIVTAPAAQAAGQLVDLANARGGHDNITVQILRARESASAQPQILAPTVVQTSPPPPVGPSGTVVIPSIRASRPIAATTTDEHPPEPRPRGSPVVIVGLILGLAGLAIAAVAAYIALDFGARKKHPVFVDDGSAASSPPPNAREAVPPKQPDVDPSAESESAPAPLPSLIERPRHHPRPKRDH